MVHQPAQPGDFNEATGEYTIKVDFGPLVDRRVRASAEQSMTRYGLTVRRTTPFSTKGFIATGTEAQFRAWGKDHSHQWLDFHRTFPAEAFFDSRRDAAFTTANPDFDRFAIRCPNCPWCGQPPINAKTKAQREAETLGACGRFACPGREQVYWQRTWTKEANLAAYGPGDTDRPARIALAEAAHSGATATTGAPTGTAAVLTGTLDLTALPKAAATDARRVLGSYGMTCTTDKPQPGVVTVHGNQAQFDSWSAWYIRTHQSAPALRLDEANPSST